MKALLLYPQFPQSFWFYDRVMEISGLKAVIPPLGILTVAALLPQDALDSGAHYLILDEGELTIPKFVEAITQGNSTGIFRRPARLLKLHKSM
jgi:radical SAM superfamily enzyme YgiQ (UPF0313 family)